VCGNSLLSPVRPAVLLEQSNLIGSIYGLAGHQPGRKRHFNAAAFTSCLQKRLCIKEGKNAYPAAIAPPARVDCPDGI